MTSRRGTRALLCLNLLVLALALPLLERAKRRPTSRPVPAMPHPATQSAATGLQLQWTRDCPPQRPAWPEQPRLRFDAVVRPVVHSVTVLVASSTTDSVTALDANTGAEKWRYTTDGPVRFAPVVWEERAYFVSDDGHLYCVDLTAGRLVWKFRGGPSDRKLLGNDRLISTWPARGAPVIADATVYFAAGIWPFMGVFVHAVDARTGNIVWTSDGDGSTYRQQPHHADAFGGIAPQGTLAVAGDKLLVPGGRSVPACYDRATGKLLHYLLAENSRLGGGPDVSAAGGVFLNGGALFEVETGHFLTAVGEPSLLADDVVYACAGTQCQSFDLRAARSNETEGVSRYGRRTTSYLWDLPKRATVTVPKIETMTVADRRLYAGAAGQVFALELPLKNGAPSIAWQAPIQGTPAYLAAGAGRLFVSTREGRLYCFGPAQAQLRHHRRTIEPTAPSDDATHNARGILATSGVRSGYCVVWGGSARLVSELVRQSSLHVIAIEPDEEKVRLLRQQLIAQGLYGTRAAVLPGDERSVTLPPYFASLMVADREPTDSQGLRTMFAALRPYGGVALLPIASSFPALAQRLGHAGLQRSQVREVGGWLRLSREGALRGAADWTHENADAANTRVSHDQLVMAPLGVLWFGGPPLSGTLPRHGHGPQPQVIDGRLIVEGVDMLRAVDVYTGRLLWETRLLGLGQVFDNTSHQPGANASGSNYVSTHDGIYVAHDQKCVRLNPTTGKVVVEWRQAPFAGEREPPAWSYLNVCDKYLVAGANPTNRDSRQRDSAASSKRLVVMDRHSGKVLWSVTAQIGFRHNAICIGAGRLFCIDRPSLEYLSSMRRHGETSDVRSRLRAIDLRTGREEWSNGDDVFGTWLSYSATLGVLVETGRMARDTLYDEAAGMRAYCAANGAVLWQRSDVTGPAMIRGATVLTSRGACDLRTGATLLRHDPLTGAATEWTWTRGYGCNTPVASEHLLTFRSGAAGYCDLRHDAGTGNFGGFRSGCTNNLIVADGVLNAPDYTRTCTCSYQNQTSLALVPMPEAEMWTYFGYQPELKGPVRRVGVNLGKPGNRKADDGTLWLEYPPVGGPSPRLHVTTVPEQPEYFHHHASHVQAEVPWVAASGAKGLRSLSVTLGRDSDCPRSYTVRLHFVEPERLAPGQRLFNVALQGQTVLRDFDVSAEAGGPDRGLVREFHGVRVGRDLTVDLAPADCAEAGEPVLCGVEIVAEGW